MEGEATYQPKLPDLYISDVTPGASAGVTVTETYETLMFMKVDGVGAASFTVEITNSSLKTYVYERVVDGEEVNIEGVYSGDSIDYQVGGVASLDEIAPGQTVPPPATPVREGYVFIGWYTDEECTVPWNLDIDIPRSNLTLYGGWEKMVENPDEYHADFTGLVEALLSDSNNCLNNSNVIFNAVISSLNSSKRPNGDAPIVHCDEKSISGGTMSAIASYANSKLTQNLEFIFVADEDPAYENSRMCIYIYYSEAIDSASNSAKILVYKQVVTRRADGVWIADGTYVGYAEVGNYFGGGKNGADVRTINPYSWKAGEIPIDE